MVEYGTDYLPLAIYRSLSAVAKGQQAQRDRRGVSGGLGCQCIPSSLLDTLPSDEKAEAFFGHYENEELDYWVSLIEQSREQRAAA